MCVRPCWEVCGPARCERQHGAKQAGIFAFLHMHGTCRCQKQKSTVTGRFGFALRPDGAPRPRPASVSPPAHTPRIFALLIGVPTSALRWGVHMCVCVCDVCLSAMLTSRSTCVYQVRKRGGTSRDADRHPLSLSLCPALSLCLSP